MAPVLMRSKLFVPGSRPELFSKALASEADAISIDLEDAVEETRKAEARIAVGEFLHGSATAASRKLVIVRVNAVSTAHFISDIETIVSPQLALINLPMAESAADVRGAAAALARVEQQQGIASPIGLLVNIESPKGLRLAAEIAGADARVAGLQLGFGDLLEPLGIDRRNPAAVQQVQLMMRLAAGEAGVWAVDSAFAAVKDPGAYRSEAEASRRLGYIGKSCIHPSQIALANEVFRPSDKEIAEALRIVEASRENYARGVGAFMFDGRMIDAPFTRGAEAVVAAARRLGLLPNA